MRLLKDVVPCCVLLVLAFVYGSTALDLPAGRRGDPGPAAFPLILAGVLGLLSLVLLAKTVLAAYRDHAAGREATADTDATDGRSGLIRLGIAMALTVGFVAGFQAIGYVIATAVYTALLSLLFRRDKLIVAVIAAAVTTGMLHILFVMVLGVRLPAGILS